eukprot:scaffold11885_cov129-Isochrysis_galbana.AAC.14
MTRDSLGEESWRESAHQLRDRGKRRQGFASEAKGSDAGVELLDGLQPRRRLSFTDCAEGRTIHAMTIVPHRKTSPRHVDGCNNLRCAGVQRVEHNLLHRSRKRRDRHFTPNSRRDRWRQATHRRVAIHCVGRPCRPGSAAGTPAQPARLVEINADTPHLPVQGSAPRVPADPRHG